MKPAFIAKNKTEWIRLSKELFNIPYPNKVAMWELSKPSPNSKQILFLWSDKNHYKAMIKLMFFNKKQTKECGFNNTKSLCELGDVIIHENYRGQGLCKKIIKFVVNYFKKNYKSKYNLFLTVDNNKVPALKCYAHLFKDVGDSPRRLKDFFKKRYPWMNVEIHKLFILK
jgi:hypothetical protein